MSAGWCLQDTRLPCCCGACSLLSSFDIHIVGDVELHAQQQQQLAATALTWCMFAWVTCVVCVDGLFGCVSASKGGAVVGPAGSPHPLPSRQ